MEASTEETGEDKKPEIKCEPKEEKQGKETTDESSSNTESKKKSRNTHTHTHTHHASQKHCVLFFCIM